MIKNQNKLFVFFSKWLKTTDLLNFSLIIFLIILGMLFVTTASPSIAIKKGLSEFYFIKKHYIFIFFTLFLIFIFSFLSNKGLVYLSFFGLFVCLILLILTLFQNQINNGASRWVSVLGYSLQPSEISKPFLVIVLSYFLSSGKKINLKNISLSPRLVAFLIFLSICCLLILQPNFSMIAILLLVFLAQYYVAGLDFRWTMTIFISTAIFFLTPASISCSNRGIPNLSYVFSNSGSTSSKDAGPSISFGAE